MEEIVRSLRLVRSLHARQSRELIRDFKITGTQLGILRTVGRTEGISTGELGRRVYLHISTVSGIVDRLEAAGYLARRRGNRDRRVVYLDLTQAGRRLVKRVPVSAFGLLMRDIEGLSPSQLDTIRSALQILLRVMKIDDAGLRRPTGSPAPDAKRRLRLRS